MELNQIGSPFCQVFQRAPLSDHCYSCYIIRPIRLFVDDCVCYSEIRDSEDTVKHQEDIVRLDVGRGGGA